MTMTLRAAHLVMHGLAVKKLAPARSVAELLGEDEAAVAAEIEALVASGQAISVRVAFMLTPAGQVELAAVYAGACAELRADRALGAAYGRFEVLNRELKQLVTDWQTLTVAGEKVPNDHSNADWDTACIDRLGGLHDRSGAVLADLAAAVPRLRAYSVRLSAALDRVERGEHAYFSAPKLDSYHTVWFELHEDLLRLLGRSRDE